MEQTLTLATFQPHLQTRFRACPAPDTYVDLTLTEANDLGSNERQERFELMLQGPLDAFLPQATYRLEHEQLGALDLFIVPVRKEAAGFLYQAVFNRLL